MQDGYYWARYKGRPNSEWEIIELWRGKEVWHTGHEVPSFPEDYEFGDKIEIPEKYES